MTRDLDTKQAILLITIFIIFKNCHYVTHTGTSSGLLSCVWFCLSVSFKYSVSNQGCVQKKMPYFFYKANKKKFRDLSWGSNSFINIILSPYLPNPSKHFLLQANKYVCAHIKFTITDTEIKLKYTVLNRPRTVHLILTMWYPN